MPYDPEGPVAKHFTPLLVNELITSFNIPDDAQDAADYINMLIGQGRTPAEICSDVKEVINIPIDETFMGRVFDEIRRLEAIEQNQQSQDQVVSVTSVKQEESGFVQPEQNQTQQTQTQQTQTQQTPQTQFESVPQESQAPRYQAPQYQAETSQSAQTSVFPQPSANPFQAPQSQTGSAFPSTFPSSFPSGPTSSGPTPSPQFPTGPQGSKNDKREARVNFKNTDFKRAANGPNRGVSKGSGVGKDYVSNGKSTKKSFGLQNAANLQKALALASSDSVNMQPFTPRPPKGRCPDFPHCKNRECELAHPTKKCFAYPNCPNQPGTCDYLHPSEDGDLMAELERTKQQFLDRKHQKYAAPQVTLCKYGILCSKELCPFGHPTPANQDAKVIIQKWCRENKACSNAQCEYAHSSPNYQAPAPAPAPAHVAAAKNGPSKFAPKVYSNKYAAPRAPTTLEQCKFGWNCTNASCNKRHATSQVACRAGYGCTRMDCTFNHPIDEECRFGDQCKNSPCYFRHPDGREKALFAASGTATMDRTFAVAEDQVMEQATQM